MSNVVKMLLKERIKSYEVLIKNSNVEPIMTGHCSDCQHEHHEIDFKEQFISPTPIPHESKPDTHIHKPDKTESENESLDIPEEDICESESVNTEENIHIEDVESESESLNSEEVNTNEDDDDLMFL